MLDENYDDGVDVDVDVEDGVDLENYVDNIVVANMMNVRPGRDKRDWTVGHPENGQIVTIMIMMIMMIMMIAIMIMIITIMIINLGSCKPTWGRPQLQHGSLRMKEIPTAKNWIDFVNFFSQHSTY